MEGSDQRLRGAIRGRETLLEVEGSTGNQRQREAIRIEGSDQPDRSGEKQSKEEGNYQRWRGAVTAEVEGHT